MLPASLTVLEIDRQDNLHGLRATLKLVATNLTLSVEDDLLLAARKVALDRHTSINRLVREFLERLVAESGERKEAMLEIQDLLRQKPYGWVAKLGLGANSTSVDSAAD